MLTSWGGGGSAQQTRSLFVEHGIPSFATPEQAVRAFMHLVTHRRNQELLSQTPPSSAEAFEPDVEAVRALLSAVLAENRDSLTEPEAKSVLEAYGIASVPTRVVATAADAARAASAFGAAVALKILSRDISHKSDVGGVVLDLETPEAVAEAAEAMLRRVAEIRPDATVDGFTVQPMARRPGCFELIVGGYEDRQFGPVLLFGQGGTAVEVIHDTAIGLPPLNLHLAHEMMKETRIHRQLVGYRDRPAVDLEGIAKTLVRLSRLFIDHPQITELDVNPLMVDAGGVLALDARIAVKATTRPAHERLAIRPYPVELEETIALGDGRTLLLRPIVPEDEPSIQRTFASLTPEEIRLRFFVPIKTLSHVVAARFTQIDYDREMALVLTEHGIPGRTTIWGVVRISADPDLECAEYAILIHHDMTGLGLGTYLMRRIIDYARDRGIGRIEGDVLVENRTMRKLCAALGFHERRVAEEPGLVRVSLAIGTATDLQPTGATA
jgi:acetyltransferase